MFYGFDTDDAAAATAALLVYAVYRSRDRRRYKVTPDMWAQIERFTKSSAKRALSLPAFIEALKPRLACETLSPHWMRVGLSGVIPLASRADNAGHTEYVQLAGIAPDREFLTRVIAESDPARVIDLLYRETAWVILLVRDRLERERPIESQLDTQPEEAL